MTLILDHHRKICAYVSSMASAEKRYYKKRRFSAEFGRMSISQKLYLLARLALPFIKPKGWISQPQILWWKRPYEVSGILIEKI